MHEYLPPSRRPKFDHRVDAAPMCEHCGGLVGGCDCINDATAPDWYAPSIPVPTTHVSQRTRDHRCGKCAWGGTGSVDCPNYKGAA